jgi:hypothetical protein
MNWFAICTILDHGSLSSIVERLLAILTYRKLGSVPDSFIISMGIIPILPFQVLSVEPTRNAFTQTSFTSWDCSLGLSSNHLVTLANWTWESTVVHT